MRSLTGRHAQVAASGLAASILLGCSSDSRVPADPTGPAIQALRDEVTRIVPDAPRNAQLQVVIDRYETELRSFQHTMLEFQDVLQALNADPNASRVQFTELIARYEDDRKGIRARLLQTHQDLLNGTSLLYSPHSMTSKCAPSIPR